MCSNSKDADCLKKSFYLEENDKMVRSKRAFDWGGLFNKNVFNPPVAENYSAPRYTEIKRLIKTNKKWGKPLFRAENYKMIGVHQIFV